MTTKQVLTSEKIMRITFGKEFLDDFCCLDPNIDVSYEALDIGLKNALDELNDKFARGIFNLEKYDDIKNVIVNLYFHYRAELEKKEDKTSSNTNDTSFNELDIEWPDFIDSDNLELLRLYAKMHLRYIGPNSKNRSSEEKERFDEMFFRQFCTKKNDEFEIGQVDKIEGRRRLW